MTEDRRKNYGSVEDPEFFIRLDNHIKKEEEDKQEVMDRMDRIENDLRPLSRMYWAILGSGSVAALLLLTLLYIYQEDKGNLSAMQQAIYRQGLAIERLLASQSAMEKDIDRIERK